MAKQLFVILDQIAQYKGGEQHGADIIGRAAAVEYPGSIAEAAHAKQQNFPFGRPEPFDGFCPACKQAGLYAANNETDEKRQQVKRIELFPFRKHIAHRSFACAPGLRFGEEIAGETEKELYLDVAMRQIHWMADIQLFEMI